VLHTGQLVSRYDYERSLRPRLISILSRQLERHREQLSTWEQQRRAVRTVVERRDQVVRQKKEEVDRLLEDRQRTERSFQKKYDDLCRGLALEREKADARAQEQNSELERAADEERRATQALSEEEARHGNLRSSLDQTVAQLDEVRTNMQQCQAIVDEWSRSPQPEPMSPELLHAVHRIEDTLKAREQIRSQARTVRAEVLLAQEELARQRTYSMKMEDFVRRVSSGGGRYVLDAASKREATRLLAATSRLRTAAGLDAIGGGDGHREGGQDEAGAVEG